MNSKRIQARLLSALLSVAVLLLPAGNAEACPHCAAAAAGTGLAGIMSGIAGTGAITSGTAQMNQGQATQNQAQMAMGAMQIAMGLLGMLAAAAAAAQAAKGNKNVDKSNSMPGSYPSTLSNYGGTSPTPNGPGKGPDATGTSSTGDAGNPGNTISISSEDLRTGDIGMAMNGIEKNFGIPRDKFFDALKAGIDPKDLLANAPKNAPSMDTLNKIADGLAANSAGADTAKILASVNASPGGGISNAGLVEGAGAVETAKGARAPASKAADSDEDLDANNMSLSPEVRAAMAARAAQVRAEKEMKEMHGWSIFQLVHNRYQKLETMLYGRVERTNPNPSSTVRQ